VLHQGEDIERGASGSTAGQDGVEEALAKAAALITFAARNHQYHRDGAERLPTPHASRHAARLLVSTTTTSLRCTAPPPGAEFAELVDLVAALPGRGVRVELLCTVKHLAEHVRDTLLSTMDNGVAVRVRASARPSPHLLIADGTDAVLASGAEAVLVRAPAVLVGLSAFFASTWAEATDLGEHARLSDRSLGALGARVLCALVAGHTDDAAARELGMSVRTYRRHVADIMRELDVTSRFAAGARAAALGLFPTERCAP